MTSKRICKCGLGKWRRSEKCWRCNRGYYENKNMNFYTEEDEEYYLLANGFSPADEEWWYDWKQNIFV